MLRVSGTDAWLRNFRQKVLAISTLVENQSDLHEEIAWRGPELFASEGWSYQLTKSERDALSVVVDRASGQDLGAISEVTSVSTVLTDLAGRLSNILERGTGVVLLRDFISSEWDEHGAGRAFWHLSTLLGTPVSQSAEGDRLFHVRDAGFSATDPRYRGPMSRKRLSFHTDRCDVIAFLCLQPALQGGETFIVSSVALCDELRRSAPETLEVLRQPYPYLRHTVDVGNTRSYCELPIFSEHEGYFAAHFLRVLIDRADVSDIAPTLTTSQRLALDALETLAEDPGFHVSFGMEAGDLLFLNNWTTFHRRNEFIDTEAAGRKRHLLRIWLAMADSRPIAPCFVDHFGATAAGVVRGGMRPVPSSND